MRNFKINLSVSALIEKAKDIANIHEVNDLDIEEPLQHLLNSLNSEAQLSESGAPAMERRILHTLISRLRMLRDFKQHPEIHDQKIEQPLILTGGGRTGSTKLHQLIAASGDFKFMTFWQAHTLSLQTGDRNEDPKERISLSQNFIEWFNSQSPRARLIHPYDNLEPEEETHLYEKCKFGHMILAFAYMPGFAAWYINQDFRKEAIFLKDALKYLQWQFYDGDPRPWILKYPPYQNFEPVLREVFPDATMVATHRNPIDSLTSSCSLASAYFEAYSNIPKQHLIGPMQLEGLTNQYQRLIEGRRNNRKLNVLDVGYTELLQTPADVIEKIYAHAKIKLNDQARLAMSQWSNKNRQHKHGVHKYTLESFSLNREIVEKKFSPYIEMFNKYF